METTYLLVPLILFGVVVVAVWLDRWSVPVILVSLGIGIVCGSDGLGLWDFDDAVLANALANVGLVFILFQGGLATKSEDFRAVALPASGLATWGVLLTAGATFGVLHFGLGWSSEMALLVCVVISSTDAAATFSILRRHALPKRLSSTIEIESAANDPLAFLMTIVVVESLATGESQGLMVVPLFLWKFAAGPVIGWAIARATLVLFDRLNPQERGFYDVLLIAAVLSTYGLSEIVQASGMLAVFTAGVVMGNRPVVYKQGILNFAAAVSTVANIGVFVMMGLLVFPREWAGLWREGVVLFLVLTFVARPVAVWIGTLGMRFTARERLFMCWAGLRGAVPIVLATYPMAANVEEGRDVFNLVFFTVLLSVSIQGSTLGWLARRLGLSEPSRPQPRYGLELVTMARSELDLFAIDMPGPKGRPGPRIRDLVLPPRAVVTLISRADEVVAPTGNTRLLGWDRVTVLARIADGDEVRQALLAPSPDAHADDAEQPATVAQNVAASATDSADARRLADHVVLLGHGRVGSVVADFLARQSLPFVVIEQDLPIVERLRRARTPVVHGEGDSPRVLDRAGIARARLMLVTSADVTASLRAIEHAQSVNPALEVVARVHNDLQFEVLRVLPRTQCVQGELELAHAMARLALTACGVGVIETETLLVEARRRGEAANDRRARAHGVQLGASEHASADVESPRAD